MVQAGCWLTGEGCRGGSSYLQEDGEDDERSDAVHHAAVVGEERLAAAPGPDVELLDAVVIVIVCWVVGKVVLNAGAGGSGVTAAERDAVHEVLPLHVTEDTTATVAQRQRSNTLLVWVS